MYLGERQQNENRRHPIDKTEREGIYTTNVWGETYIILFGAGVLVKFSCGTKGGRQTTDLKSGSMHGQNKTDDGRTQIVQKYGQEKLKTRGKGSRKTYEEEFLLVDAVIIIVVKHQKGDSEGGF